MANLVIHFILAHVFAAITSSVFLGILIATIIYLVVSYWEMYHDGTPE